MLINSIQPAYLPQQNSKTTNTINTEKEKENCFQWWQTHKQLTELDAISFSASVYKVSDKLTARLRTFIAWTVTQAASRIQHARDQTGDERTSTKPTAYQRQQATKHSLYSVNSSVDHLNVGEVPEPSKMVCSSSQKKQLQQCLTLSPLFSTTVCIINVCMNACTVSKLKDTPQCTDPNSGLASSIPRLPSRILKDGAIMKEGAIMVILGDSMYKPWLGQGHIRLGPKLSSSTIIFDLHARRQT